MDFGDDDDGLGWGQQLEEELGDDFLHRLVDFCIQEFKSKHKLDITVNDRSVRRLRTACERATKTLSSSTTAYIEIDTLFEDIDYSTKISRAQIEQFDVKKTGGETKENKENDTTEYMNKVADSSTKLDDNINYTAFKCFIYLVGILTDHTKAQGLRTTFEKGKGLVDNFIKANQDEAMCAIADSIDENKIRRVEEELIVTATKLHDENADAVNKPIAAMQDKYEILTKESNELEEKQNLLNKFQCYIDPSKKPTEPIIIFATIVAEIRTLEASHLTAIENGPVLMEVWEEANGDRYRELQDERTEVLKKSNSMHHLDDAIKLLEASREKARKNASMETKQKSKEDIGFAEKVVLTKSWDAVWLEANGDRYRELLDERKEMIKSSNIMRDINNLPVVVVKNIILKYLTHNEKKKMVNLACFVVVKNSQLYKTTKYLAVDISLAMVHDLPNERYLKLINQCEIEQGLYKERRERLDEQMAMAWKELEQKMTTTKNKNKISISVRDEQIRAAKLLSDRKRKKLSTKKIRNRQRLLDASRHQVSCESILKKEMEKFAKENKYLLFKKVYQTFHPDKLSGKFKDDKKVQGWFSSCQNKFGKGVASHLARMQKVFSSADDLIDYITNGDNKNGTLDNKTIRGAAPSIPKLLHNSIKQITFNQDKSSCTIEYTISLSLFKGSASRIVFEVQGCFNNEDGKWLSLGNDFRSSPFTLEIKSTNNSRVQSIRVCATSVEFGTSPWSHPMSLETVAAKKTRELRSRLRQTIIAYVVHYNKINSKNSKNSKDDYRCPKMQGWLQYHKKKGTFVFPPHSVFLQYYPRNERGAIKCLDDFQTAIRQLKDPDKLPSAKILKLYLVDCKRVISMLQWTEQHKGPMYLYRAVQTHLKRLNEIHSTHQTNLNHLYLNESFESSLSKNYSETEKKLQIELKRLDKVTATMRGLQSSLEWVQVSLGARFDHDEMASFIDDLDSNLQKIIVENDSKSVEMILEKLESTLIRLHMRLTKTFEEEFLKSQKEIAEALFSICPGFKKDRNNANAIYAYLKSKKFTEWQASDNYLTRNEVKTLVETCNKLVKRKKFEEIEIKWFDKNISSRVLNHLEPSLRFLQKYNLSKNIFYNQSKNVLQDFSEKSFLLLCKMIDRLSNGQGGLSDKISEISPKLKKKEMMDRLSNGGIFDKLAKFKKISKNMSTAIKKLNKRRNAAEETAAEIQCNIQEQLDRKRKQNQERLERLKIKRIKERQEEIRKQEAERKQRKRKQEAERLKRELRDAKRDENDLKRKLSKLTEGEIQFMLKKNINKTDGYSRKYVELCRNRLAQKNEDISAKQTKTQAWKIKLEKEKIRIAQEKKHEQDKKKANRLRQQEKQRMQTVRPRNQLTRQQQQQQKSQPLRLQVARLQTQSSLWQVVQQQQQKTKTKREISPRNVSQRKQISRIQTTKNEAKSTLTTTNSKINLNEKGIIRKINKDTIQIGKNILVTRETYNGNFEEATVGLHVRFKKDRTNRLKSNGKIYYYVVQAAPENMNESVGKKASAKVSGETKSSKTWQETSPSVVVDNKKMSEHEQIYNWLSKVDESFGEAYAEALQDEGVDKYEDVKLIDDTLLLDAGVTKRMHRTKILKAVTKLNQSLSSSEEIGGMKYDMNQILGNGSTGRVYRGTYKNKNVAIKRVYVSEVKVVDKEVKALGKTFHSNIVQLLHHAVNREYHYMALELCSLNLNQFLYHRRNCPSLEDIESQDCRFAVKGLIEGVKYAHGKRIIHRDLKPENILLVPKKGNVVEFNANNPSHLAWDFWVLKIADWGLSRETRGDASFPSMVASVSSSINSSSASISGVSIIGSSGYMAPEIFQRGNKTSYNSDIFSLGILLHMCLTNGDHPFDTDNFHYEIQKNIKVNNHHLPLDDRKLPNRPGYGIAGALDLITSCLQPKQKERPRASDIVNHSFFWSPDKWVSFINNFVNTIKTDLFRHNKIIQLNFKNAKDKQWKLIINKHFNNNWTNKSTIIDFDGYTSSMYDCLRYLRNLYQHRHEKIEMIQQVLGESDASFWNSFVFKLFPRLPAYVYKFVSVNNNDLKLGMNEYMKFYRGSSGRKNTRSGNNNKRNGANYRGNKSR